MNRKKLKRVGKLLLAARRRGPVHFPFLSDLSGKKADRTTANKFMLCCILDYKAPAHVVVENATRFAEKDLGDPRHLWNTIVKIPRWNSDAVRRRYAPLHPRFPKRGHARVGRIARELVERYDGDARKIWRSQPPGKVLKRLEDMNVGPKISRMIVGALYDTEQICGAGELAPDIHVRRVLGRVFTGEVVSPDEALEIARGIRPRTSWKLDGPFVAPGKIEVQATKPPLWGLLSPRRVQVRRIRRIAGSSKHGGRLRWSAGSQRIALCTYAAPSPRRCRVDGITPPVVISPFPAT